MLHEQLCERHRESVIGALAGRSSERNMWVRQSYMLLAVSISSVPARMVWRGSLERYRHLS